jgi:hypothetical protein
MTFLNTRKVQKNYFFLFNYPFRGGMMKLDAFLLVFDDEIKHQQFTFLWHIENIFGFFVTFHCFLAFLKYILV